MSETEPAATRGTGTAEMVAQVEAAYRGMAQRCGHRPAANDAAARMTAREAHDYALAFLAGEQRGTTFDIGCPDFGLRPTLVYLIESARCLCTTRYVMAVKLLQLPQLELSETQRRVPT